MSKSTNFLGIDSLSELTKLLLEGTIAPSPHSIDLSHSATSDFLNRQIRKTPNVAELFHENSKVNPFSTLIVPGDDNMLNQVRTWFFDTAYNIDDVVFLENDTKLRLLYENMSDQMFKLLSPFSQSGQCTNLLYAVDLLVLNDSKIFRVIPQSEFIWTEKIVLQPDLENLLLSLRFKKFNTIDGILIFLVACPWRYMLLYGPRGYRHTLMDLGRLLSYFENHNICDSFKITVRQNFHDTTIDEFISADGLERSVYAVLQITWN